VRKTRTAPSVEEEKMRGACCGEEGSITRGAFWRKTSLGKNGTTFDREKVENSGEGRPFHEKKKEKLISVKKI